MIDIILHSALFGLTLTFGVYILMSAVNQRTGSPLLNPVLLAILTIVAVLLVFDIPLQDYLGKAGHHHHDAHPYNGAAGLLHLQAAAPAEEVLPAHCTGLSGRVCRLDDQCLSVLPSVGDQRCSDLYHAAQIGYHTHCHGTEHPAGRNSLGHCGCGGAHRYLRQHSGSILIKVLRIKNRIAAGVCIGCSSHAGGTSKAMEIGDVEGTMSGVSIGIAGIITVVLTMFIPR